MEKGKTFLQIDQLIQNIDQFKCEPLFTDERNKRQNKTFSLFSGENEIFNVGCSTFAPS